MRGEKGGDEGEREDERGGSEQVVVQGRLVVMVRGRGEAVQRWGCSTVCTEGGRGWSEERWCTGLNH